MTITSIISAIGNTSSQTPLIVRDCFIEVPSKILIARRENLKESREVANDATRERFIDEYATSAIWLGGIPLTEYFVDKYISKKGYNPNVNLKLFKEEEKTGKEVLQGIEYNINKFKNLKGKDIEQAVADLLKVKNNKSFYEGLMTKKFVLATAIPTVIMGFVLPPLNFALTKKIRERKAAKRESKLSNNVPFTGFKSDVFEPFRLLNPKKSGKGVSFTGGFVSTIANLRTIDKMALSDGGLTIGRVTTSRNKEEASVNAFRMIGSMILNFVTPVYIAKGLDKLANKLFKINVNLDPLILSNDEFAKAIKENKIELPKSNSPKDLLAFIDNNPNSLFSKFAQKMKKVSYLEGGIRDPRKYVNFEDLAKFKTEFEIFVDGAKKSKNIQKFAKKATKVKCANIIANVAISSFLLAGVLPKLQYQFTKLVTGSYSDPGLVRKKV